MEPATTIEFARAARAIGGVTRALGLVVPGFRSPPRTSGLDRALRRRGRVVTVSVRVKGRPLAAVHADMIEGVVVGNRLDGAAADRVRRELWLSVAPPAPAAAA
jgi:hypothetical protein